MSGPRIVNSPSEGNVVRVVDPGDPADGRATELTVDHTGAQRVTIVGGDISVSATIDTSTIATQTTLAAVLAKLSSDPATNTTLASILSKISADPATQTTLAAVLAKLSADPATNTTLTSLLTALGSPAQASQLTSLLTAINGGLPAALQGGALKVALMSDSTGQLAAIAASAASLDGKTVAMDTTHVAVTSSVLPTGASTAALQSTLNGYINSVVSALGTPPSSAITIQGAAGMTPVTISGSVTASGTVTANQGGSWSVTDATLAAVISAGKVSTADAAAETSLAAIAAGATGQSSAALENSHVFKTAAGILYELEVEVEPSYAGNTPVFLEIVDKTTVPADGTVVSTLLGSYRIDHVFGTPDVLSLVSPKGTSFTLGCAAYLTTTRWPTKTGLTGGNFAWFTGAVS